MRKLLVAAVGLLTVLTAIPVYAVDVNFSGEVRARAFWTDNLYDGNSGGSSSSFTDDSTRFDDIRFRLKTSITAGVSTGVVVLDFSNCLAGGDGATFQNGIIPGGGVVTTGDCRFGTAGLGGSYNAVGIRESYLKIDLSKVGLILGRQSLKVGHGIILDDTADAITVVLPMGSTTITGVMLQLVDIDSYTSFPSGTGINQDTTVWLVNVGMDQGSHIINFYDAFLYDQAPGTTAANSFYPTVPVPVTVTGFGGIDKMWVNYSGISLDVKSGPMALAFEGTYDFGSAEAAGPGNDVRVNGWNVMGDATIDTGGAKVGGTVVYASGQDQTAVNDVRVDDISGNFQLGNILLNHEQTSDRDGASLGGGFAGMGILAAKLHVDMMPTEKLDVDGAVIYAQTTELCNPVICFAPTTSRTIGYELDANAKYRVDDNLIFAAGAGYLITAGGATQAYSVNVGPGANSNLWKVSGKAVFTF